MRGYKVFNPDWTCSPNGNTKQYTCPGKFEEDITPIQCGRGMHFCKKAADCFNYYNFNPENKVAEVVAYGVVTEEGNKCCTNKLEIVREIPWQELLDIVNTGNGCTGLGNSGNRNSGNYNSGDCNTGDKNIGDWNSGYQNSGNCNSGKWNSGYKNSGNFNSGKCNTGDKNIGDYNTGNYNSGNCNSGNFNSGDWNSGDWNKTNFSNGCFNTIRTKIYMFNKPSEWTYRDWLNSDACAIMHRMPDNILKYILFRDMTDEEKAAHPEAEITGGYLKKHNNFADAVIWWNNLSDEERNIVKAIPNFNKIIFKEITGIDVGDGKS